MAARTARYDSLDLWRGIACLFVLLNHSVFYSPAVGVHGALQIVNAGIATVAGRLWAGVPIFFVISGYCISASVDSQRVRGTSVSRYFLKRFRRIFPPYWIVLVATVVIIGAVDVLFHGRLTSHSGLLRPWWYSAWQWIGSATLTEIWRWHFVGGRKALLLGHAWTLCYEEQFYAVAGLLLFVCPSRYFLGAAGITTGVAVVAGWAMWSGASTVDGFFFDGAWIQFALGIWLYYAITHSRRARVVAAVAFVCVVLAAASHGRALLNPDKNGAQVYFVAGLFALTALALHRFDAALTRAPALRWLLRCGEMCYSLYLVHLPVANLVRAALEMNGVVTMRLSPFVSIPLCAVPAIWIAWIFHQAIERRFMSAPAASTRVPLQAVSAKVSGQA